jgi:hypothetical protein
MSNSYVKAAFSLFMSADDAAMVAKAQRASDLLTDNLSDADLKLSFDALGYDFITLFPAKGPNHFGSFLDLFDDPSYPTFDCDIEIGEADSCGVCEVTFRGEQFAIEAVANLIHVACKSALPCGFEWSCTSDKLRCDEFGGGYVVITEDGPAFRTTSTLLREALTAIPAPVDAAPPSDVTIFDPELVTIELGGNGAPQSQLQLYYGGVCLGNCLDLIDGDGKDYPDEFWVAVAYREATLRGFATRLPVAEEAAFMAPLARS